MVFIRSTVSGPVFSIFCLPTLPKMGSTVASSVSVAQVCMTPRGPNFLRNVGLLRIVGILRLFLGVEVIEVAEELVEAVDGREELVQIAEVVLAELSGGVAEVLHEVGDAGIFGLQPDVRTRQADFGQPGADGRLTGDERRATGGAALLAIPVGEQVAFIGDAVDVGRVGSPSSRCCSNSG